MSRRELDETLEYLRNIERAQTPEDVCKAILKAVNHYGFQKILAGTIPMRGANKRQQQSNVVLHDWPTGWSERYFSNGYLFVDPAIKRLTSDVRPFLWNELDPMCRDDPMAARVMNEAGDFRLKTGFTVPMITLDGDVAGFSLAGEALELPPNAAGMITLVANYALGHALNLGTKKREAMQLGITSREHEVLQWAAAGKSEWEISEILNISEHTVDKFLRDVRVKLGAVTRTQAIAEAFRLHIIS